ncbi:MAG: hypothetical protein R6U96_05350 [Promethearchaeia archaeon]
MLGTIGIGFALRLGFLIESHVLKRVYDHDTETLSRVDSGLDASRTRLLAAGFILSNK